MVKYFSHILTTLGLDKRENLESNIASLEKVSFILNLLSIKVNLVVLSMIKATLLKVYYSLSSREGKDLDRDGIFELLDGLNPCLSR
jgi:hypothetical protein